MTALVVLLAAQITVKATSVELGSRPPTGIQDNASVFDADSMAELTGMLRNALEDHYLECYVVTYDLIRGETGAERAARIRNTWARNPFAIALVFDASVYEISLVGTRDLENFVSRRQLEGVFQRAGAAAVTYVKGSKAKGERPQEQQLILHAMKRLLTDPVLAHRPTIPESNKFSGAMYVLLGVFALLALIGGGLAFYFEKRLAKSRARHQRITHFPPTHMPTRLGGLYSGGISASLE